MIGRVLIAALLVVACDRETPPPVHTPLGPTAQPGTPAPDPRPAPVTTLAGEWRVAGIDGKPVEGSLGIALRADAREIWWEPRCAGFVRSYTIDGSGFSTGPYIGFRPRKPGEPTPPVCTIAPPPQMVDIFRALNAATLISRTPSNGVEMRGGGHSLLLFSQ